MHDPSLICIFVHLLLFQIYNFFRLILEADRLNWKLNGSNFFHPGKFLFCHRKTLILNFPNINLFIWQPFFLQSWFYVQIFNFKYKQITLSSTFEVFSPLFWVINLRCCSC